jgi:hypothetical protein
LPQSVILAFRFAARSACRRAAGRSLSSPEL